MKSKKKQRILALILSMVLMLSASISAMAEGDVQTEASGTEVTQNQAEEQSLEEETVPETEVTTEEAGIDTQSAEISEEPVQETTEQETAVTSGEATEPVQEATGESTETEVPTTEETTGEETQSVEGQPEEITTAEEQPEETSEETLPEEEVVSEAAELKQEFTDENGNVTQTITAYVPEGAFQATADQISMEVTLLNTDDTNYIKGMMEELIPENNYLDGYVLYQIDFKVNGEITKPAKAITIIMTGNELAVEDAQKAHVFYYDSEDPEVEGDEDQLIEVIQKDQLIKSLEESGQSTENIEDYDCSEIAVNEGNADTITVKGWESTIYGCYVEKESVQEATYEDDTVKVTVSADEKGIIPNKTTLQVVPISNNGDTKDQYKEVEKKLQEKAEKDEYEIAGFLAYDISFVDKDGNEVEPNGEVRVSIEYKEAALPEGMTEEEAKKAEVSMIHLEEDENGEVKEVVNMAEKDQVEAIATTESQQVEKVAVKTESFSTFTIIWNWYQVTVHYVDNNGHEIDGSKNGEIRLNDDETVTFSDYKSVADETYEYTGAFLNSYNGVEVEQIRYNLDRNRWEYRTANDNWKRWESNQSTRNVYLVYNKMPSVISTEDTAGLIDISLYDYDYNQRYNGLLFNGASNTPYNDWIGNWGYSDGNDLRAVQGIMDSHLYTADGKQITASSNFGATGYPVTVLDNRNNKSNTSSSLLSDDQLVASGLNHLFTKDEEGYYTYNSDEHYAYYDPSNGNKDFKVYSESSSKGSDELGDFMPLVPINQNQVTKQDDWYYGMTISFNFIQPENGRIKGKDMVFEFSGDDDVWVYIDGRLVLDIGGIHGNTSGSINFATGEVKVNGIVNQGSDYTKAYGARNGLTTTLDELFDLQNGDYTFEDFSEHRLDFFYLERGAGDANCYLKFNMPPKPDETIVVGKQITDANASVYSDVDFTFKVEIEDGNENWSPVTQITKVDEEGNEYSTNQVDIYNGEGTYLKTITLGIDGTFTLKHGEFAYLTGFPDTTQYRVTETGVDLSEYDNVELGDVGYITVEESGEEGNEIRSYRTYPLLLENVGTVVFRNRIAEGNKKELQITKRIDDDVDDDTEYYIQVFLGEEAQKEEVPYNGEYWIEGEKQSADDGVITLKKNQTASIMGIPSGTSFKVIEIEPLDEKYIKPVYSVYNAEGIGTDGAATGKLIIEKNAEVTVRNALRSTPDETYLEVKKTFEGIDDPLTEVQEFKISLKNTDNENIQTELTLIDQDVDRSKDGLTYTWRIAGFPAGEYQIKEEGASIPGYDSSITINGNVVTDEEHVCATQSFQIEAENEKIFDKNDLRDENSIEFIPNLIVGSYADGYFIWTEGKLSVGERATIISFLKTKGGFTDIQESDTVFFSGEKTIEEGISYHGTVSMKESEFNNSGILKFTNPGQWNQVYCADYKTVGDKYSEIEITNAYTPQEVPIDLQKYGSSYDTGQKSGAIFTLYEGIKKGNSILWNSNPLEDYERIEVSEINTKELVLKPGYYKLTEIVAPNSYSLLGENIYFQVKGTDSGSKVILVNQDGEKQNDLDDKRMWQIVDAENPQEGEADRIIQIKNEILYELPSAGGPGIFLYMIGGTLLLMAGSLMIYINRRKGVLRK